MFCAAIHVYAKHNVLACVSMCLWLFILSLFFFSYRVRAYGTSLTYVTVIRIFRVEMSEGMTDKPVFKRTNRNFLPNRFTTIDVNFTWVMMNLQHFRFPPCSAISSCWMKMGKYEFKKFNHPLGHAIIRVFRILHMEYSIWNETTTTMEKKKRRNPPNEWRQTSLYSQLVRLRTFDNQKTNANYIEMSCLSWLFSSSSSITIHDLEKTSNSRHNFAILCFLPHQ